MTLEALLHNQNALPSAPKVIEELIGSFDNPAVSVDDIARTLSTDPVLSAKLLRLANSAYYHVSRSIGSVDDAVRMLGFASVRMLVISSGLVNGFKTVPGLDLKHFWRYSLHTGVAAKWIARHAGENAELAFTLGMMHSIGQLVIHIADPERAQALDKIAGPYDARRIEEERAAFGYTFADVGAALALHWKFPAIFAETLLAFPAPLAQDRPNRIAAVVHLAAWRARIEHSGASRDEAEASFPGGIAASLGLAPELLPGRMPPLAELSAGLDELAH